MTNLYVSAIIAWVVILIVGFIKDLDLLAKIPKENRKPIYLVLDFILGAGLSALYYVVFKLNFNTYIDFCEKVIPTIFTLYSLYEHTKFRDIVKIAKEKLVSVIGKNVIDKKVNEILGKQETVETAERDTVSQQQL